MEQAHQQSQQQDEVVRLGSYCAKLREIVLTLERTIRELNGKINKLTDNAAGLLADNADLVERIGKTQDALNATKAENAALRARLKT